MLFARSRDAPDSPAHKIRPSSAPPILALAQAPPRTLTGELCPAIASIPGFCTKPIIPHFQGVSDIAQNQSPGISLLREWSHLGRTCRVHLAMSPAEVSALEAVRASFGGLSQADAVVRLLRDECLRQKDREDCAAALHLLETADPRGDGGRPATRPRIPQPAVGAMAAGGDEGRA